jgi:diguanylate cyclase (GGDEF)-like protein
MDEKRDEGRGKSGNANDADFRLFAPFVIVTLLSIGALIILMVVLAGRVDSTSSEREQTLLANALQRRVVEIENTVVPLAQPGGELSAPHDGEDGRRIFHISATGEPMGRASADQSYHLFSRRFSPLVQRVQDADATTAGLAAPGALRINGRALQASQFAVQDGALYVLTATLVQPREGGAPKPGVLLTATPVDLSDVAGRYLLSDLHVAPVSADRRQSTESVTELHDDSGRPVGVLAWTGSSSGRELYIAAILPILLVVCSVAGIAILTFGRGRRVAQGLIESEARATHMALHDGLTGLPNRILLVDRLSQALEQLRRRSGAIAVLGLDLDRFKEVNDTFGHQSGDELLREVARRLADTCRTTDTVARLGGDEFAIVQSEGSAGAAAALARRLNEALSAPIDLAVGRVYIGCSIGISVLESADCDPVEALRQADLALYRAKDAGRGQHAFFEPEMDAAQRLRRAIESDLREAITSGGLQMAYQAQVDGAGETTAVEALVRWNHPVRGPIAPEFFVGVAEECGLIEQLGIFTLRTAFIDSRRWPEKVRVAVNISPAQLRLKTFMRSIEQLLAETGAKPDRFELEITEGVFMGDDPHIHETLRRLRELGFSLALDDFGSGYSSLSYLRKYPVDKIKIDASFVAGLGRETDSDAVVGAIVRLGRALNLAIVAEGVETADQRRRLRSAGCSDVQGFLFSRPMAAREMDEALSFGSPRQAAQ